MLTLLLLTAVSGWNYDGFVAESDEPRSAARREDPWNGDPAPIVPATSKPLSVVSIELPVKPELATPHSQPTTEVKSELTTRNMPPTTAREVAAPGKAAGAPPVVPTVWRLSDSSGQAWDHVDSAWLARWVASRNAELARQRVAAPAYPTAYRGAPVCTTGRCPQGR
jgi:hypothetical protein